MAACPQCAGEIKEGARKCPHCKTYLDPALAAERMGPPPGPAGVEISEADGEAISASGLVMRSCIELAFAFGTLIIGPICGGLTVAFASWEVWKCISWNSEYQKLTGKTSVGAVSAAAISGLAAILAAVFTWMILQKDPL